MPFETCEPPCQPKGGYNVNLIPGQFGKDVAAAARAAAAKKAKEESASHAVAARPCTLPPAVQEFVELIFSEKMMQQQLESLSIDLEKMPLGGMSDKQAERGYQILGDIAAALKEPLPDESAHSQRLLGLTEAFYNSIPHKFSLKQTPPVINTRELLLQKIEVIEALLNVNAAQSLAGGGLAAAAPSVHPTDSHYATLKCGLTPASADEFAMVQAYAANTHAATHNTYTLKVKHVFRADRAGEAAAHTASIGNRQLLWHGSRLTNWVGILSQGLRIAPPEAPVTGYMFGKGVYFADMVRPSPSTHAFARPSTKALAPARVLARSTLTHAFTRRRSDLVRSQQPARFTLSPPRVQSSKSANYCFANRDSPSAVLLLCDVALGEQHELIASQFEAAEKSKKRGKHSTWGVGKTRPDPAGATELEGGALKVPMGQGGPNQYLADHLERIKGEGGGARSELLYNEFIVYDTKQIHCKYVVVVDFEFL